MRTGALSFAELHDPDSARTADRDALSLSLMDARNRTLRWLSCFESAGCLLGGAGHAAVPLRSIGHAGWFQEFWISRHLQRGRGESGDAASLRLASIEPRADDWFDPVRAGAWRADAAPDANAVRGYLADTLDTTLDLLAGAGPGDDELHVFRLALLNEDRLAEALAVAAQWLQVDPGDAAAPCAPAPARAERAPLWLPAQRFALGSKRGGLVPPNERWAHEIDVPDFEIDAQAVSWSRFIEFAEDGGYDDRSAWSAEGWAWAQAEGRRAPRGVEQLRGGVLLQQRGQVRRAAGAQPAVHLTWYEADAWCRWAGRRLPIEVEWELAACTAASRGFAWGDVLEWCAGTARAWPGGTAAVAGFAPVPPVPPLAPRRVLRGASSWTLPRLAHPKARRFAAALRDDLFCGFRSCAP
jgi:formylglycine-generating enzyme required for sulfatase activity